MDIHSPIQEKISRQFKEQICLPLDLSHLEVSFTLVNSLAGTIYAATTDYQWHLNYWGAGLDKTLSQRLVPGVITWDSYDSEHIELLRHYRPNNPVKVDICTRHNNLFELFSVNLPAPANFRQINRLLALKPTISAWASKIFRQHIHDGFLPFRDQPKTFSSTLTTESISSDLQDCDNYQFGSFRLTPLEMDTIRLLLMHRSIKEIANLHQCHEKVERKRLNNIKRKTGCEYYPMSFLFDQLKKHGVIQACLSSYIIFR